jgi:hypothetical protein
MLKFPSALLPFDYLVFLINQVAQTFAQSDAATFSVIHFAIICLIIAVTFLSELDVFSLNLPVHRLK